MHRLFSWKAPSLTYTQGVRGGLSERNDPVFELWLVVISRMDGAVVADILQTLRGSCSQPSALGYLFHLEKFGTPT